MLTGVDLVKFLIWIIGGGSVVAFSWIMEQLTWFQNLPPEKKRWITFGGSTVLALAAWAVNKYVPAETLAVLAEPFTIIASIFVMVLLNQYAHKVDSDRRF